VPLVAGDMVFVFNQSDISGGVPVNGATPLVVGTVGSGDVAAGSISLTVGSDLAEGVYRLVSIGRSAAGVYGKPSAVAGLTIDTTAPLASSLMSLASASDTGIAGDGITNVQKPVMVVDLAGTGIQAGDRVELLGAANAVIGTALATAADITAGTIAVGVTTVLSEGQHAIRSRITDLAGNVGAVSPAFTLTVDLTPPSAPGNLGLDASSDTGDPGDGITQDSTPTISGTGGTPGEIISLYDGNGTSPVGVAVVGGDGKWSVTPAAPLSGGAHSLTVTTTDMGGNESGRSQPLSVTVDTAKPTLVTAETTLDGTRVVLTFNETLSATTAAVSGFAVQSGTGSTLSGWLRPDSLPPMSVVVTVSEWAPPDRGAAGVTLHLPSPPTTATPTGLVPLPSYRLMISPGVPPVPEMVGVESCVMPSPGSPVSEDASRPRLPGAEGGVRSTVNVNAGETAPTFPAKSVILDRIACWPSDRTVVTPTAIVPAVMSAAVANAVPITALAAPSNSTRSPAWIPVPARSTTITGFCTLVIPSPAIPVSEADANDIREDASGAVVSMVKPATAEGLP